MKEKKGIQWKRCLERVSLGMNSATKSRSSPSAQHPIKFTILLCRTFPTPQASVYTNNNNPFPISKNQLLILFSRDTKKHKQYHKLMWVRPGELGEALNGNKAIVSKLPFVNHIGSFLSTLRDYQFTTEPICCCSQLCQLELLECRHAIVLL